MVYKLNAFTGRLDFTNAAVDIGSPLSGTPNAVLYIDGSGNLASSLSVLAQYAIEANVAGSGAPNVLVSSESRSILTNEGTSAMNYHTLPTASAGLSFSFYCQDADGIHINAATGDTIRLASNVSSPAGYTESTTVGSVVTLVAINATEWVAISIVGTWTTV